jgi:predicted porin
MKKSLIALAALAATASFAQSSVQITGVLDAGFKAVSHDDATKKANTVFNNGVSTSQFDFIGTTDLGGGLKGGFFMEMDVNPSYSSTLNQASNGTAAFSGTPFTGQQVVSLEGNFGRIKVGTPDSAALDAALVAQPFGTNLGGGYSSGFGRLGTASVSGVNQYVGGPNSTGRIIRSEKALRYDTPAFSGFSASVEYSAKNDYQTDATKLTSNNNGFQALGLRYANGPLTAQFASAQSTAGANQAAGSYTLTPTVSNTGASGNTIGTVASNVTANGLAANQNVKWNLLGVNYVFGDATVYAGATTTKASDSSEDSKSWNIAGKYTIGQYDLMAQYLERKSNLASQAAAPTAKLTGLGLNYNFSKTFMAYYRMENVKNITIASGVGQAQTVNAVGMVVKF